MSKIKKLLTDIWKDESGQGAMEYVLILVVVGALIMTFKTPLLRIITERTDQMGGRIKGFMDSINP